MATATTLSMAEYLETSYKPDCEFVDGELKQRNVGKWEHSRVQAWLARWIGNHEDAWNVWVATEQRLQVTPERIRIPDLVAVRTDFPPDVLLDPPLLVVEILSPDDSYTDLQQRSRDYAAMGVGTIWLIDPQTRSGRMCQGPTWIEAGRLEVPGTAIHVELAELFARLDATRRPA